MITIDDFLNIEGNSHTKQVLLDAIERKNERGIEYKELTFNVYSVAIDFNRNEVVISDDVCPDENPPVTLPLDTFYLAIAKFEK